MATRSSHPGCTVHRASAPGVAVAPPRRGARKRDVVQVGPAVRLDVARVRLGELSPACPVVPSARLLLGIPRARRALAPSVPHEARCDLVRRGGAVDQVDERGEEEPRVQVA